MAGNPLSDRSAVANSATNLDLSVVEKTVRRGENLGGGNEIDPEMKVRHYFCSFVQGLIAYVSQPSSDEEDSRSQLGNSLDQDLDAHHGISPFGSRTPTPDAVSRDASPEVDELQDDIDEDYTSTVALEPPAQKKRQSGAKPKDSTKTAPGPGDVIRIEDVKTSTGKTPRPARRSQMEQIHDLATMAQDFQTKRAAERSNGKITKEKYQELTKMEG